MSIGLVLEGGAMRGLYTAGVLDVFLDNNIKVDGIIGVSAGVLFGVNYLSKQKGRGIRYNKKFAKDKRYMGIRSFLTTGNIINKDFDQNINIINDYHYKVKNIINDFNTTEYILFLKALFTSSNLNSCSTKISSLDKFLISEYSTIIFITDSTIVNIITKDEIISEQIINNAKKYKFQKIYSENNFLPYNIFEYN